MQTGPTHRSFYPAIFVFDKIMVLCCILVLVSVPRGLIRQNLERMGFMYVYYLLFSNGTDVCDKIFTIGVFKIDQIA